MKFYTRSGQYKASNVCFNPSTKEAYSYSWWRFVQPYRDGVLFNTYRYSTTTARHQLKVRRLLSELGIKVVAEIESPRGLQRVDDAAEYHRIMASNLREAASRKGTKASKNAERLALAKQHEVKSRLCLSISRGAK